MSRSSKGTRMELECINRYEAQGYTLLHRAIRSRWNSNDICGCWDIMMFKDGKYLFIQVTEQKHWSDKIKYLVPWVERFYNAMSEYHLTVYRMPHWEGRCKNKVYHQQTEWRTWNIRMIDGGSMVTEKMDTPTAESKTDNQKSDEGENIDRSK